MSSDDTQAALNPNAAPLEQNVKNLECEGVPYRVVKEESRPLRYVSSFSFLLNHIAKVIGDLPIKKRLQEEFGPNHQPKQKASEKAKKK